MLKNGLKYFSIFISIIFHPLIISAYTFYILVYQIEDNLSNKNNVRIFPMKKLILTLFIFFGLNGCITLDKGKSTNVSKKSDVVSTKKTTLINQTKETTSNNKKSDQKIIEWKCYKGDYKNKYEK